MIDRKRLLTPALAALALLLLLTLAVRVGVLMAMQENLRQDPDAYKSLADNLVWFRVYGMGASRSEPPQPTAYRPPLYPLLLAKLAADDGGVVLWRVGALHVLLALATVWLMWIVAGQLSASATETPLPLGEGVRRRRTGEGEDTSAADEQHPHPNPLPKGEGDVLFRFTAGLLVACDPILLRQSTLIMTEMLAAFLTVLCLFCLNRFTRDRRPWNAGLAGGAIALAILCRPTYLPWLALVGLMMLLPTNPKRQRGKGEESPSVALRVSIWRDWLRRGLNVAALALIAAVVVSPWAIRNYRVFGKPIVATTHGGYTFYLANNRDFYEHLHSSPGDLPWDAAGFHAARRIQRTQDDLGAVWTLMMWNSTDAPPHPEILFDRWEYRDAWRAIEENRAMFFWSCLYRLRQLWSPLPHQLTADEPLATRLLRYAVAAWYVGVYLLAAVGIWKLRSRLLAPPWLWGLLLCLVFTGIHTFYWTNLRMRAPLMPVVALVAAYGVASLWQSRRTGFQPVQAG